MKDDKSGHFLGSELKRISSSVRLHVQIVVINQLPPNIYATSVIPEVVRDGVKILSPAR